jgi:hypothetical protein
MGSNVSKRAELIGRNKRLQVHSTPTTKSSATGIFIHIDLWDGSMIHAFAIYGSLRCSGQRLRPRGGINPASAGDLSEMVARVQKLESIIHGA